jgi:cAMP-dependent protein kinase regulator
VSAEVYGSWNKRHDYIPKVVKKSEEQIARIRTRLGQAFMFSALDEKEKKIVIDAMEEKDFNAGDMVISQGEDGDVLYVVDSGKLDCFKRMTKDGPNQYLKTYHPGESFGELALLYNAPRAASIVAKEDSVCFSLDRECFNGIVKDAAMKKRERYIDFLGRVEILDSLDSYEKAKICDCLQPTTFQPGEYIIKQGEQGNTFYFLEEGEAEALKKGSDSKEEVVYHYKENDYFGELALINDMPRQASVRAKTACRVVVIDRLAFNRLLGNLVEILKRNSARYEQKMKELGIKL